VLGKEKPSPGESVAPAGESRSLAPARKTLTSDCARTYDAAGLKVEHMRMAGRVVEVQILGRKILLSAESDEDYVREIAEYVNDKMERIAAESQNTSTLNVAILAALDIADEYFKQLGLQKEICEKVDKKCLDLVNYIDSQLQ
jgi:cell division protein ZapA